MLLVSAMRPSLGAALVAMTLRGTASSIDRCTVPVTMIGAHNRSSMIWLTERRSRYLIPVTMPDGYDADADNSPRSTLNTTRSFSSGLFFEAFAMLISLRQTQTAD